MGSSWPCASVLFRSSFSTRAKHDDELRESSQASLPVHWFFFGITPQPRWVWAESSEAGVRDHHGLAVSGASKDPALTLGKAPSTIESEKNRDGPKEEWYVHEGIRSQQAPMPAR